MLKFNEDVTKTSGLRQTFVCDDMGQCFNFLRDYDVEKIKGVQRRVRYR